MFSKKLMSVVVGVSLPCMLVACSQEGDLETNYTERYCKEISPDGEIRKEECWNLPQFKMQNKKMDKMFQVGTISSNMDSGQTQTSHIYTLDDKGIHDTYSHDSASEKTLYLESTTEEDSEYNLVRVDNKPILKKKDIVSFYAPIYLGEGGDVLNYRITDVIQDGEGENFDDENIGNRIIITVHNGDKTTYFVGEKIVS